MKVNLNRHYILNLLLLLFTTVNELNASKFLIVFPTISKSHVILGHALGKELVRRGHDVTMVSPFPSEPMKGYRDVNLDGVIEIFQKSGLKLDFSKNINAVAMLSSFVKNAFNDEANLSYLTMNHTNYQKIIGEKYDAIIMEIFFADAMTCMGHHFDTPMIAFFPNIGGNFMLDTYTGNPTLYSITPNVLFPWTDQMNFKQRVLNTLSIFAFTSIMGGLTSFQQERIKKQFFPNSPSVNDCKTNFSIYLVAGDDSYTYPRPQSPNVINIGGFHVEEPNPLPIDLQDVLDKATQGVIFFSMGSNLQSKDMPPEKVSLFLEAFKKLDQVVLWKWEDETLPNKPKNVVVRKWFPQSDVLAHKNVKLFITHGGLGGMVESISRAVPLLFLPMFADQFVNAFKAENYGFGKQLDFNSLTIEKLYESVNELLSNSSYKTNMQKRNAVLMEKPVKQMDLAVFWSEYVAKHRGAPHLRSAGLQLNFFQYYLIDVIAFLTVVLLAIIFAFVYCVKLLKLVFRKIFCRKQKVE